MIDLLINISNKYIILLLRLQVAPFGTTRQISKAPGLTLRANLFPKLQIYFA